MRYYCIDCGAEIITDRHLTECPVCGISEVDGEITFIKIPDHETPEERKKRTGEPWPDNGPVWVRDNDTENFWIDVLDNALDDERYQILCAYGPKMPSNDWKPEEKII